MKALQVRQEICLCSVKCSIYCLWQWVTLLQKELVDITEYSKVCESERDRLRDEKETWVKTEVDLRDSVKKLKDTCAEMEQSSMELGTKLQVLKACAMQYLL